MSEDGNKAATPKAGSRAATPADATPKEPSTPAAATPKDGSKAPTPKAGSTAATPAGGSQLSIPHSGSRGATPTEGTSGGPSAAGSGIALDSSHSYQIRPRYENKFRPQAVKEQIRITLNEELGGKAYSEAEAKGWVQNISDQLRTRMKELGFERYKIVVQTVIGEQHGEGVKMGVRCLWDSDTDNYASDVFINESMFCVTAVYGVYYY